MNIFIKKRAFLAMFLLFLGTLCILCFIVMRSFQASRHDIAEQATATAAVEYILTEEYGEEVSSVIEHFELKWHSREAITNTEFMSELAVYPYLNRFGYTGRQIALNDPNISWSIVKTADVQWLRVLEYTPQRFKAVASVYRMTDKINLAGGVTETNTELPLCGIYVFIREGEVWKLNDFLYTNGHPQDIERDWHYIDDAAKDVIGKLPDGPLCTPWPCP